MHRNSTSTLIAVSVHPLHQLEETHKQSPHIRLHLCLGCRCPRVLTSIQRTPSPFHSVNKAKHFKYNHLYSIVSIYNSMYRFGWIILDNYGCFTRCCIIVSVICSLFHICFLCFLLKKSVEV